MQYPKDIPDDLDRVRDTPAAKLALLASWVKRDHQVDPRGGGWSFVGKPEVVQAILDGLPSIMRKLMPKFHVSADSGNSDADVVFSWENVAIRVRHKAKGLVLHAVKTSELPPSIREDRVIAAEMRMRAWLGLVS